MSKSRQTFAYLLIGLVTVIVSLVSATFLLVFGLILAQFLVIPMAFCISALFTALTAAWLSNWLVADEQHTALRPVVAACEAVAIALALLLVILSTSRLLDGPIIFVSLPAALIVAVTAVFAARQYRSAQPPALHETRQALIWIALAIAAIPLTILIASLFGWAGA